jgi:cobalamin synthase
MRRALSFLTPLGGAADPAPSALAWFPAVGALIGLAVGGIWWAARQAWAPPAAAAIAVIADAALTGMLHLDGLADAADGLLPPLPRARRLEVMADPRLGAFGVTGLAIVLLARFGAFASMLPSPLAVAGLWSGSRTAMAVTVRVVPYARPAGLASAFRGAPAPGAPASGAATPGAARPRETPGLAGLAGLTGPVGPAVLGLAGALLAMGLAFAGRGAHGLAAVGAEAAAAAAVVFLAWRRLGGFTGDVLGAAAVVGETAGLLTLAMRW